MKTNTNRAREIEALRRLLEIHGADRTRWPARERLRFAHLLAEDAEASALLAEAEALDRLLDRAPRVGAERQAALADRIVAAAIASGRPGVVPAPSERRAAGNVLDLGEARSRSPVLQQRRSSGRKSGWQAAALMAASLVLGVLVGATGGLGPSGFDGIADDLDNGRLALVDDAGAGEGDLL